MERVTGKKKLAHQILTIDVGQTEVENDHVGLCTQNFVPGGAPGRRFYDLIAVRRQTRLQQPSNGRLVVDHEDTDRKRFHATSSRCGAPVLVAASVEGTGSVMVKLAPVRSVRLAAAVEGGGRDELLSSPVRHVGLRVLPLLRSVVPRYPRHPARSHHVE